MKLFIVSLGFSLFCLAAVAQEKRPVTVSDCVETRRLASHEGIQLSPNGAFVAYIVKEANTATNHNDYKLFVSAIEHAEQIDNPRLLFQADSISRLNWLHDNRHIAFLSESGSKSQVSYIDVNTGRREVVVSRASRNIWDYGTDSLGETIAFAVPVHDNSETRRDDKHGYFIKSREVQNLPHPLSRHFEVFLLKVKSKERVMARVEGGAVGRPNAIKSFVGVRNLSLSPDGKYLTFAYDLFFGKDEIPKHWKDNPFVEISRSNFGALEVLGLYDLRKKHLQFAIDSPHADSLAVWSEDSRAYSVIVVPPVESPYWQNPNLKNMHLDMGSPIFNRDMFTVNIESRVVSQVFPSSVGEGTKPLSWKNAEGEMVVASEGGALLRLAWEGKLGWKEVSRSTFPFNPVYGFSGNDKTLVTVQETSTTPPALNIDDLELNKTSLATELNPQFHNIRLGGVEKIAWTNKYGAETTGYLIKPIGYKEGRRDLMEFLYHCE